MKNTSKLKLYKEILELKKQITDLETQIKGLDTEVIKVYYTRVESGSDQFESYEVNEEEEYKTYLSLYNKYKAKTDTYKTKVDKINNLLNEHPIKETMTEAEILDYEIFCRDIFMLDKPRYGSLPNVSPMHEYINECDHLKNSNHWYPTNGKTSKSVNIFGKIYVYTTKPKEKPNFSLKSILFRKQKKSDACINKYDVADENTMEKFYGLQKLFKYTIFNKQEMTPYFEKALEIYNTELSDNKSITENYLKLANESKQILDNAAFAKEAQKQITALNIQYEEKMRQFSLMEDDNELSNSKAKTYKKVI